MTRLALAVAHADCCDDVGRCEVQEEVELQHVSEILETSRANLERWLVWARERHRGTGE